MCEENELIYDNDDLAALARWKDRISILKRMEDGVKVYRLLNRGLTGRFFRVDIDYGSTGIWETPEPCYGSMGRCCAYEMFHLPEWLLQRFNFWELWHNQWMPMDQQPEDFDWDSFEAYGRSLAIDLKYYLGPDISVDHHDEVIEIGPISRSKIPEFRI